MTLALPFLLALLMSAALAPICRAIALRLGYVVEPGRQAPSRPKALFGGVAIAAALFVSAGATGAVAAVPVLALCSAGLFAVGTISDLFRMKPATKLVAVIAVASVFVFFDLRLHWSDSLTLDAVITLFWIVGITTAFTLLDNLDGLSGGIALIAGTAFLMTVLPVPADPQALMRAQYLAVLLGAIAGFLIYNVTPASIAMGEGGSLLIGLNMAAMTLVIAPGRGSNLLSIVAVPMLLLLIPIFDATLVAFSRLASAASSQPASDHSSARLVAIGLSERSAVTLMWLLAAASGLIAVMADRGQHGLSGVMATMFVIGVALFAVHAAHIRVLDETDPARVRGTIVPLGMELGYRRRVVEIVLDLLLVSVAYYGAHRLQFDAFGWADNFRYFLESYPMVLGIQMVALFAAGAYRGIWQYFSLSDGVAFGKAVFLGAVTSQLALLYLYDFQGYTARTFVVYGMFVLLLLTGSRASFRLVREFILRQRQTGRRLVIYGAGDAGALAARYLLHDTQTAYRIVGFIDDDLRKRHVRVYGYPVVGGYDHLAGLIMGGEVDTVAVTHDGADMSTLARLCATHGVTLQRLAIDWREIPVAVGAGGAAQPVALSEPRVVAFTPAGRRDRADAGSGTVLRSVEARDPYHPPIRVVHIITRLILGGAQENTLYTAIHQHRDPRFEVTLVCGIDEAGEGNMFTEVTRAGVKTVVIPSLLREIRPLTDLKAFVDLYRFLRKGSFDVVHTHSSKAGIIGRLAARAAGVPVIVHTIHGVAFHDFQVEWKNRLYITLERICAPVSGRIISVSQRLSDGAVSIGIGRRDQHITIFSGMDLDVFLSARERVSVEDAKRRVGIPPDALVVGKVARLFPLKGHDQFLDVAARIAREMPDVYFLLVGDGPLRDEVRSRAATLGFGERLVMVGRVPPETVPDYIQAMDVVVHTSLREGIARVLPQAGAVGKPVVTFALDGAPEVVRDGLSGFLAPALDMNHVADRTIELLRDPALRLAFGEAGRAFATEHFSIERMVERINAVYLELLARRQHDGARTA